MPSSKVIFVGDDPLTFVNYSNIRDLSYRSEARTHNAHKRVTRPKQPQGLLRVANHRRSLSAKPVEPPEPSPQDMLSTFARDPFADGIASEARALESVWLETFQDNFFLPYDASTRGLIACPHEAFLAASRSSHMAYQNLILLTAATAKTRRNILQVHDLFAQQALVMSQFRIAVDTYYAQRHRLSQQEFQDVFAAAFSFSGYEFMREPAYNAIVYANHHLISAAHNYSMKQLPTVEWIRTIVPRPGPRFNRNRRYLRSMVRKLKLFLDFIEEAQDTATSEYAHDWARYFPEGSALRHIVTTAIDDADVPWPQFNKVCWHRIVFILHLHLAYDRNVVTRDQTMQSLENKARSCIKYTPPVAIRLFLWSLLSGLRPCDWTWALKEQIFTLPTKEFLLVHGIDFSQTLTAWLLQEENSDCLPRIDIDAIRKRMSTYYEDKMQDAPESDPWSLPFPGD